MPGSYLIDVSRGIVFTRAWGVLTHDEIAMHASTLKDDPRFDSAFRQIIDFGGVTKLPLTTADVRNLANITPFRPDARRACVVRSDEAFGLLRMFWSFSESSEDEFRIFREIAPAMEWIGLDPQTPWPEQAPDKTFGVV